MPIAKKLDNYLKEFKYTAKYFLCDISDCCN